VQAGDDLYRLGAPLRDEGGRTATAEFCVVALGKLGSAELNYASDIDLLFIFSEDGTTAGSTERSVPVVALRRHGTTTAQFAARSRWPRG